MARLKATRRTLGLAAAAVVLSALVVADYWQGSGGRSGPSRARPAALATAPAGAGSNTAGPAAGSPGTRLSALRGALASGPQIDAAYQKVAAVYAERVAFVPGYSRGKEDPAQAVERAIRESIPPGVELTALVLGTPRQARVGVYAFGATVRLRSGNHQAMIDALVSLANPDAGFLWERLDLTAEPEARTLSATGQLAALVIEAAE